VRANSPSFFSFHLGAAMITQQRLKQLLDYNPATGVFTWIKSARGVKRSKNRVAGCVRTPPWEPYIVIRVDRVLYLAHRLAWLWFYGTWPQNEIDHIDCNPSNNAIQNLRTATSSDNKGNARTSKANTSGYKGVSVHQKTGSWRARIRGYHLGLYSNAAEAHLAYMAAARKHFGQFARAA